MKLVRARAPRIVRAALSYASAASSAVSNVPSQCLSFVEGSLISAAYLPHGLLRTPRNLPVLSCWFCCFFLLFIGEEDGFVGLFLKSIVFMWLLRSGEGLEETEEMRSGRERERERERERREREREAMACLINLPVVGNPTPHQSASLPLSIRSTDRFASSTSSSSSENSRISMCVDEALIRRTRRSSSITVRKNQSGTVRSVRIFTAAKPEPLKIMISGAPASGKGTQCELIKKKYELVHIAAGDLLRAEVAAGSENGKRAKEYMEKGQLVPNEIVVMMVKERLLQPDAQEKGWLLDGYPRSLSQAAALENLGIRPDLFIVLHVAEENLVERVVGRRLDPVTGKIYHLKYSPPETEEIAARLTQRFDDTEEKVKLRLQTHHQNVEAVLSIYKDVMIKVNGNAPKEDVFAEIDIAVAGLLEQRAKSDAGAIVSNMVHQI